MSKSTWVRLSRHRWDNLEKFWWLLRLIALAQLPPATIIAIYARFHPSAGAIYVGFGVFSSQTEYLASPVIDLACQVSAMLVLIAFSYVPWTILDTLSDCIRRRYDGRPANLRTELFRTFAHIFIYTTVIFNHFPAFLTCFGTKAARHAVVFTYGAKASRINLLTVTLVISVTVFVAAVGSILLLLHWYRHDRREWRFFIANYTNFNESPLTFQEFCTINGPC